MTFQPVLHFDEISKNTDSVKVMRGVYNPETGLFEAVANISVPQGWQVHHSKTPFDVEVFKRLSPAASKPEAAKPATSKPQAQSH